MAHALSIALATVGVAVAAGGCVGVLVMPTVLDRLHYAGPVSSVGAAALAAGAAVDLGVSRSAAKVVVVAVALAVESAVVSHGVAAAACRERPADSRDGPRGAS